MVCKEGPTHPGVPSVAMFLHLGPRVGASSSAMKLWQQPRGISNSFNMYKYIVANREGYIGNPKQGYFTSRSRSRRRFPRSTIYFGTNVSEGEIRRKRKFIRVNYVCTYVYVCLCVRACARARASYTME